ncbi:hypothetical protein V6N13_045692 [Hibiscus sabdariffa]
MQWKEESGFSFIFRHVLAHLLSVTSLCLPHGSIVVTFITWLLSTPGLLLPASLVRRTTCFLSHLKNLFSQPSTSISLARLKQDFCLGFD